MYAQLLAAVRMTLCQESSAGELACLCQAAVVPADERQEVEEHIYVVAVSCVLLMAVLLVAFEVELVVALLAQEVA